MEVATDISILCTDRKIKVKQQGSGMSGSVAKRPKKQPQIEVPPVDMILRYPVEVWVSSGEPFCKPDSES